MIQIGDTTIDLGDPLVLIAAALAVVLVVIVVMLFAVLRSAGRSARLAEPLAYQMGDLGKRVGDLSDGQERLAGGLKHVSEAQAASCAVASATNIALIVLRMARVASSPQP